MPEELDIDGASNLNSTDCLAHLKRWGVIRRLSSAYYPQSNGRAETAVKTIKRLIRGNTNRCGDIHTDAITIALLQHRNTPLRDMGKSPAELALGRSLRDGISLSRERYRINHHWASHISQRETQIVQKMYLVKQDYDLHAKPLPTLLICTKVLCQNTRDRKWDRAGIIVEVKPHRQYVVKMERSNRVSLRNRRHLQPIKTKRKSICAETSSFNSGHVYNPSPPDEPISAVPTNSAYPISNSGDDVATEPPMGPAIGPAE